MRIWSLHPRYLDSKGLVALWRETLLAQHVLLGKTKGYKQHPQLIRFKEQANPAGAIGAYLWEIHAEALRRDYGFNDSKICTSGKAHAPIAVTNGQLFYEWEHLRQKLKTRDPERYAATEKVTSPEVHPLFILIAGPVADWERR